MALYHARDSELGEGGVEGLGWAQGGGGFGVVGHVVAAEVDWRLLHGDHFGDDLLLGCGELGGHGGKDLGELRIPRLLGERLRPVEGEVDMRAAAVDGAEFAAGGAVVFEILAVGGVEGVGEDFGLGMVRALGEVFKGGREGEELAEAVPAQVVVLGEILDVLRGRTAGGSGPTAATMPSRAGNDSGCGAYPRARRTDMTSPSTTRTTESS